MLSIRKKQKTINKEITTSVITVVASVMTFVSIFLFFYHSTNAHKRLNRSAAATNNMMSEALLLHINSGDYERAKSIIDSAILSSDLIGVVVSDQSGGIIIGRFTSNYKNIHDCSKDDIPYLEKNKYLSMSFTMRNYNLQPFGTIDYYFSNRILQRDMLFDTAISFIKILLVCVILAIFLSAALRKILTSQLMSLKNTLIFFAKGNFSARSRIESNDELGELSDSFNMLAENTQIRISELESVLSKRTSQLMLSQKMATLGELAAGTAHEINTPIGTAFTAATHLKDKTLTFAESYQKNNLTRSEFETYLAEVEESVSLIISNISKSSSISQNFKKIASDRTNENTKLFNLKHYLEEIILSLKPQIRKTKHIIQINIPEHIELSTYPGVLSQVMSNLIINSLLHGFDGIEEGVISIDAGLDNDSIIMVYSDNGNGISEENLSKIFTPFFTTRKDKGGTGIGLSIVKNLIESTLKGKISCESVQGKGTMFKISFPAKL